MKKHRCHPGAPWSHYVITRYAGDWTRGSVRACLGSRVAAKHFARALELSLSQHTVVMVLRCDQLERAKRDGFVAYV